MLDAGMRCRTDVWPPRWDRRERELHMARAAAAQVRKRKAESQPAVEEAQQRWRLWRSSGWQR